MQNFVILLIMIVTIFIGNNVVAENKGLIASYKEGYEEGFTKGYEKGYTEGYKQAVAEFSKVFKEKLNEYKAIEAGKFLLKNWYITYPKVFQIQTEKGLEIIVEGCNVMRPFDDLPEKVLQNIPIKETTNSFHTRQINLPDIVTEKLAVSQVVKKVDKRYIHDIQKLNYKYINLTEQDHVLVFFDSEKSAEKFCSMYSCLK